MKIITYTLGFFVLSLAAICDPNEYERCDCTVQSFVADPEDPDNYLLDREVRKERICIESRDTVYLSPTEKEVTFDCR
ncbi:hypothetical protein [Robiginitalea biformata]|uniref:Uncharacterized protein n=1 Tax=Robiginitalea biformata (strain ATCC BAA-864 / DSM 15991 / KCTC 12146 / HTCC2501) TaxID=313596 RepID=A4CJ83_ROBBH|nr:hypothetical protein [Robiginitalea biformata]EAR16991.1 hypothetical protein RB2501_08815 [Robiginitalea biformata HTCC2501]